MPRGRHSRRASPDSSLADSRSPSPLYPRSRSRSRPTRTSSFASQSPVRSRAQSQRRRRRDSSVSSGNSSPSRSTSQSKSQDKLGNLKNSIKDKLKADSGLQTSIVFLGGIAAATYAAHKYWPKGITYGEKEEWEHEKAVMKKKAKKAADEAEGRDDSSSQGGSRRQGDDRLRIADDRRPGDLGRSKSSRGRLELEDAAPRRRVERLRPEDDVQFARRPISMQRGQTDSYSVASIASGSRAGDARRERYVEDNRTHRADRRSYVDERDERDDDDRGYRVTRYTVPRENGGRRSSFDGPPGGGRAERMVYVRQDDDYR